MISNARVKVSVCVPVYKVEAYVERCARSLFEQTMKDGIEFIFVDDCSPDGSMDVIRRVLDSYPERKAQVRFVRHEVNKGRVAARWSGIRIATGEYVTNCDSDDSVDPDLYERMYAAAKSNSVDVVVCPIKEIWMSGRKVIYEDDCKSIAEYVDTRLDSHAYNSLANKMFVRKAFEALGLGGGEDLYYGEDLLLGTQLLLRCSGIAFVHGRFYNYHRVAESGTIALEDDIEHARQFVKIAQLLSASLSPRHLPALTYFRHDCLIKLLRTRCCPAEEFLRLWPESRTWLCLKADMRLCLYKKMLIFLCSRCYRVGMLVVRALLALQRCSRRLRNGS